MERAQAMLPRETTTPRDSAGNISSDRVAKVRLAPLKTIKWTMLCEDTCVSQTIKGSGHTEGVAITVYIHIATYVPFGL